MLRDLSRELMENEFADTGGATEGLLRSRKVAERTGLEASVFARYDAQIGEMGWHTVFADSTLDAISDQHAERMLALVEGIDRPRILELGAYAHHSAHIVAHHTGGYGVSHDISAASIATGAKRAAERGFTCQHFGVAGDFHDLPFDDDAFDLVFVASSVHHTWRPWLVMEEMLRVCRPGGIVHLENEPIGRQACTYSFRGNRADDFTSYEAALDRLGLTRTVTGPFGGSRSEQLFGIVENDRIPLWVFEGALSTGAELTRFDLDYPVTMTELEHWMLDKPASVIAERLLRDIRKAAEHFSDLDRLSGFSIPGPDQIWPVAYKVAGAMQQPQTDRLMADLFGAALRATAVKNGNGRRSPGIFRRSAPTAHGVHIDRPATTCFDIRFENILPPSAFPASDWCIMEAPTGATQANLRSVAGIDPPSRDGVMILRTYSVPMDRPYFFSVQVGDRLVYSHCVCRAESHLAKFMAMAGEPITVHHHDEAGQHVEAQLHSRIVPRFIEVNSLARTPPDQPL